MDGTPTAGHPSTPILHDKSYGEQSVFTPENLLRESRRQHELGSTPVPSVCVLDPDGDVVRHLVDSGKARRHEDWGCYHSELWTTSLDDREIGIVGCAVGGPYAVLVAEQLAVSGCDLIISVTSAGRICPLGSPPYFVLITEAFRDEGTSIHYVDAAEWARLRPNLSDRLERAFEGLDEPVHRGRSWTTDAPYRETETAIRAARDRGIHAVEMEAASLYAFARARGVDVVCVAHVTNDMAVDGNDFEKGLDAGTHRVLTVVGAVADALRPTSLDGQVASWRTDHWNKAYADHGDDVSWYQKSPRESLAAIDATRTALDAAIIDIGGGTSRLVDQLATRGYVDLTVLDVSTVALSTLAERLGNRPGIDLVANDVLTWAPLRQYALWHDRAVLHFLTAEQDRVRYHALLERALFDDGVVVIGTFGPDGPEQCSGLPVRRYHPDELMDFLGPGFELLDQRRVTHTTPWGAAQPFTWVTARRR